MSDTSMEPIPGFEYEFECLVLSETDVGANFSDAALLECDEATRKEIVTFLEKPDHFKSALVEAAAAPPMIAGPLFFDLETIPDFSREHLFGFPPLPTEIPETPLENMLTSGEFLSMSLKEMPEILKGKNPPEVWIDEVEKTESLKPKPRKGVLDILANLRSLKGEASQAAAVSARNKTMATTPEMCRIVAFGWALGTGETTCQMSDGTDEGEANLLDLFWLLVKDLRGPIVGYNCLSFDLPVILARSIMLGVRPTRPIPLSKYGNRGVVDLMVARFPGNNWRGLNEMAKLYGVGNKTDGMDGSKVLETFHENPELVSKYCCDDVRLTQALYAKWSGYFC